jgi:hypothetical protein
MIKVREVRKVRKVRKVRVVRWVRGVIAVTLLTALPAAAQVRPPVLTSVTPYGLQRGTTVTLTLEGANIASTDQVVFDVPGLSATIGEYKDLGADVRKRMPGRPARSSRTRPRRHRWPSPCPPVRMCRRAAASGSTRRSARPA